MVSSPNHSVVVLDFETTGLSPDRGDRAIEIGAALVRGDEIVDHFASLMNPGRRVSRFIEGYTGITNRMLAEAPPASEVLGAFAAFMGDHPLVAHNAGFDRRFLDAELGRLGIARKGEFACTMLAARRLYPEAPDHKLETLVRYKRIETDGRFHRALADARMTARLWIAMVADIGRERPLRQPPFEVIRRLSRVSKSSAPAFLARLADEQG